MSSCDSNFVDDNRSVSFVSKVTLTFFVLVLSIAFTVSASAQTNAAYPSETVYLPDLNLPSLARYFWNGETSDGTMTMFMENGREERLSRLPAHDREPDNATLQDPDNNGAGLPEEPVYPPDGGKRGVYVSDIQWDALGNHYMLGTFNHALVTGGQPLESNGGWDIFLAKFDAWQNPEWVQSFGSTDRDISFKLILDSQDNPVVSGQFSGPMAIGPKRLESEGKQDIFLAAFTAAGDVKWARRLGGSGRDDLQRLENDENNEIRLDGRFIYRENVEGAAPYRRVRAFSAAYGEDGHLRSVRTGDEN